MAATDMSRRVDESVDFCAQLAADTLATLASGEHADRRYSLLAVHLKADAAMHALIALSTALKASS